MSNRTPNPYALGSFQKPYSGGFWASPVDAEFGWADWCEVEGYYQNGHDLGEPFTFTLADDASVLLVESEEQFRRLPKIGGLIDFEALATQYDALEVPCTADMQRLFYWDCDSILIFNPDVIVPEEGGSHGRMD